MPIDNRLPPVEFDMFDREGNISNPWKIWFNTSFKNFATLSTELAKKIDILTDGSGNRLLITNEDGQITVSDISASSDFMYFLKASAQNPVDSVVEPPLTAAELSSFYSTNEARIQYLRTKLEGLINAYNTIPKALNSLILALQESNQMESSAYMEESSNADDSGT